MEDSCTHTSIVTYALQVRGNLARPLPERVGRLEHEEVCKRFDGGNRDASLVTIIPRTTRWSTLDRGAGRWPVEVKQARNLLGEKIKSSTLLSQKGGRCGLGVEPTQGRRTEGCRRRVHECRGLEGARVIHESGARNRQQKRDSRW